MQRMEALSHEEEDTFDGAQHHRDLIDDNGCRDFGLAHVGIQRLFIAEFKKVVEGAEFIQRRGRGDNLAQRRRTLLQRLINHCLTQADAMPCSIVACPNTQQKFGVSRDALVPPVGKMEGSHAYTTNGSDIVLHPYLEEMSPLSDGLLATLAKSLYHEARHVEQHGLAARVLAMRLFEDRPDANAQDVAAEMRSQGMEAPVADYGSRKPMRRDDPRTSCGALMWGSIYLLPAMLYNNEVYRGQTRLAGEVFAYRQMIKESQATKSELDDALRAFDRNQRAYENMYHEWDALALGEAVHELYEGKQ